MENSLELLEPLTRLFCTIVVVILFFLFIVRPLLNYVMVNREIERRKRLNEEMQAIDALVGEPEEPRETTGEQLPASTKSNEGKPAANETLNRLATSDPDKAGDLVKKWINSE